MTFAQWFAEQKAKAESADYGKAFLAAGFQFHHTGGFITVWRKQADEMEALVDCQDSAIDNGDWWNLSIYAGDNLVSETDFPNWQSVIAAMGE